VYVEGRGRVLGAHDLCSNVYVRRFEFERFADVEARAYVAPLTKIARAYLVGATDFGLFTRDS